MPTAKLEVTGAYVRNPKRAAGRANEPRPSDPLGDPPPHLQAAERDIWREVAVLAPWATASDRLAVELVCSLLVAHRLGGGLATARLALLVNLLARLGMTPADRSRVAAPPPEEPEDPAEQFFA